jgi:hypothetical protein
MLQRLCRYTCGDLSGDELAAWLRKEVIGHVTSRSQHTPLKSGPSCRSHATSRQAKYIFVVNSTERRSKTNQNWPHSNQAKLPRPRTEANRRWGTLPRTSMCSLLHFSGHATLTTLFTPLSISISQTLISFFCLFTFHLLNLILPKHSPWRQLREHFGPSRGVAPLPQQSERLSPQGQYKGTHCTHLPIMSGTQLIDTTFPDPTLLQQPLADEMPTPSTSPTFPLLL